MEVRLDVFLDVACLFPTRSQAAAACKGGKVDLNGAAARPNRTVRVGDRLEISFRAGRRSFVIRALSDHHIPKQEARSLTEETTPALSPEAIEARRLERLLAPRHDSPSGKLSHRERRERERLRGF